MLKIHKSVLRMSPNRLYFDNLPELLVSENIDIPLQGLVSGHALEQMGVYTNRNGIHSIS